VRVDAGVSVGERDRDGTGLLEGDGDGGAFGGNATPRNSCPSGARAKTRYFLVTVSTR